MSRERDEEMARKHGVPVDIVQGARTLDGEAKAIAAILVEITGQLSESMNEDDNVKRMSIRTLMALRIAAATWEEQMKGIPDPTVPEIIQCVNSWTEDSVDRMFVERNN